MTDIDLTPAVNAAARAAYEQDRAATKDPHRKLLPEWDGLNHAQRFAYLERLLPIVHAAHRSIAAQALRKVAADLGPQGLADEHVLFEAAADYEQGVTD